MVRISVVLTARGKRPFLARVLYAAIFSLAVLMFAGQTAAQSPEPAFTSHVDYAFGQMMRFHLRVENLPELDTIKLLFRAPEFDNTFTVNVPFEPGEVIDIVTTVEMSQVSLAPFTTVTYWWQLTDAAGQEVIVPQQAIRYDDNRYDWNSESGDGVTVYWASENPELGDVALKISSQARSELTSIIPVVKEDPIRIYIYPSSAELRAALRLTGRDWDDEHASPDVGVVMVPSVNDQTAAIDLAKAIPHEMTHYFLYQATGKQYDSLPKWLSEGLASGMESGTDLNRPDALEEAIASRRTIKLSDLCRTFGETEEHARLAAAQSVSLVDYIRDQYEGGLDALIRVYARGAGCDAGVVQALGLDLSELEKAWLREQQPRSRLAQFLDENGLWLIILAAGFGISRLLVMNPGQKQEVIEPEEVFTENG